MPTFQAYGRRGDRRDVVNMLLSLLTILLLTANLPVTSGAEFKKHVQNSVYPYNVDPPSYNIDTWARQLHLQQCAFVEVGDKYYAIFVETRPRRYDRETEIREYFVGLCDGGTLARWPICSADLRRRRRDDCLFDPRRTYGARVHRRFCDIMLIARNAPQCDCNGDLSDSKLFKVEGFPTCFKAPMPESLCGDNNVCGLASCTPQVINKRVYTAKCDRSCRHQQPFCEIPGKKSSEPLCIRSFWTDWGNPFCTDASCVSQFDEATCINRNTGRGDIDCLGPGTSCCTADLQNCRCHVYVEDGTAKVFRTFSVPQPELVEYMSEEDFINNIPLRHPNKDEYHKYPSSRRPVRSNFGQSLKQTIYKIYDKRPVKFGNTRKLHAHPLKQVKQAMMRTRQKQLQSPDADFRKLKGGHLQRIRRRSQHVSSGNHTSRPPPHSTPEEPVELTIVIKTEPTPPGLPCPILNPDSSGENQTNAETDQLSKSITDFANNNNNNIPDSSREIVVIYAPTNTSNNITDQHQPTNVIVSKSCKPDEEDNSDRRGSGSGCKRVALAGGTSGGTSGSEGQVEAKRGGSDTSGAVHKAKQGTTVKGLRTRLSGGTGAEGAKKCKTGGAGVGIHRGGGGVVGAGEGKNGGGAGAKHRSGGKYSGGGESKNGGRGLGKQAHEDEIWDEGPGKHPHEGKRPVEGPGIQGHEGKSRGKGPRKQGHDDERRRIGQNGKLEGPGKHGQGQRKSSGGKKGGGDNYGGGARGAKKIIGAGAKAGGSGGGDDDGDGGGTCKDTSGARTGEGGKAGGKAGSAQAIGGAGAVEVGSGGKQGHEGESQGKGPGEHGHEDDSQGKGPGEHGHEGDGRGEGEKGGVEGGVESKKEGGDDGDKAGGANDICGSEGEGKKGGGDDGNRAGSAKKTGISGAEAGGSASPGKQGHEGKSAVEDPGIQGHEGTRRVKGPGIQEHKGESRGKGPRKQGHEDESQRNGENGKVEGRGEGNKGGGDDDGDGADTTKEIAGADALAGGSLSSGKHLHGSKIRLQRPDIHGHEGKSRGGALGKHGHVGESREQDGRDENKKGGINDDGDESGGAKETAVAFTGVGGKTGGKAGSAQTIGGAGAVAGGSGGSGKPGHEGESRLKRPGKQEHNSERRVEGTCKHGQGQNKSGGVEGGDEGKKGGGDNDGDEASGAKKIVEAGAKVVGSGGPGGRGHEGDSRVEGKNGGVEGGGEDKKEGGGDGDGDGGAKELAGVGAATTGKAAAGEGFESTADDKHEGDSWKVPRLDDLEDNMEREDHSDPDEDVQEDPENENDLQMLRYVPRKGPCTKRPDVLYTRKGDASEEDENGERVNNTMPKLGDVPDTKLYQRKVVQKPNDNAEEDEDEEFGNSTTVSYMAADRSMVPITVEDEDDGIPAKCLPEMEPEVVACCGTPPKLVKTQRRGVPESTVEEVSDDDDDDEDDLQDDIVIEYDDSTTVATSMSTRRLTGGNLVHVPTTEAASTRRSAAHKTAPNCAPFYCLIPCNLVYYYNIL